MQQLEHSSRIDGMTQLLNRSSIEMHLGQEFKRCQRYKTPLSLLMFDLDHFKLVNDTYGHLAGDEVLRRVSKCLRDTVRETDLAGRYGGEEFMVIATETAASQAVVLAERIRQAVAAIEFEWQGQRVAISCSLGVAGLNESQPQYEALIQCADQALYRAKETGRNRYCCYET